jgi:glycosyltransferase involved in cell wall biosynthesis/GT2 family glycosyltransferase
MNTDTRHKPDDHRSLSKSSARPRILFVVDTPHWAHDFKTENLKRVLGNEYEIRKCYQNDLTEEDIDRADLILVYYWLQLERLPHLTPAFRRNRKRLLVGVTGDWELEEGRREAGLAFLREFASAVFVINLFLYRDYQRVLEMPLFYTPNGVDTAFYHPPAIKEPISPVRVGWAGSLTNREAGYRGYRELIVPAVAAVEGMELVTAAREEEWRGPAEMRNFYQSLDIYINASRTEGAPNPCLEAAACGVPLLTTRVGNMPELLRDGVNGFFIERDVEDLKQKLCLLRDNPALRTSMGQRIHEDIKNWDWKILSQPYRQMFEQMLNEKAFSSHALLHVAVDSEASGTEQFVVEDRRTERVKEALIDRARKNASLIPHEFLEKLQDIEITIVMLSYGRSDKTLEAVRSLRDNVRIPFRLLLIDNNSGDEVREQLEAAQSENEFLELTLLKENLGCTRGRMYALQFVNTDYVMFVDNDFEVLPGAVEHLLYTVKLRPDITAATGMAVFPDGLIHVSGGDYWSEDGVLFYDLLGKGKPFDDPGVRPSGACNWVNASLTIFNKSVLLEHPFDVSLDFTKRGYYEDLEWCYRLKQNGVGRFERVIESLCIHYHESIVQDAPISVEDRRQQSIKSIEGIAYFYKKHGLIIQNFFDFVPELMSTKGLSVPAARIFLELVNSRGGQWVLDRWNDGQLAPLFNASSLSSLVAEKDQTIESLARDVEEKDQALRTITQSLGWRLLKLYGKIKYPYLLPVYRLLRLIPRDSKIAR